MAGVFGFLGPEREYRELGAREPVVEGLLRVMGVPAKAATVAALNAAFVLVADHELSPSTFTARIAASVGASLHSCVGAAFDVYRGSVIGLLCDDLDRVFGPGAGLDAVLARIETTLVSAQTLKGFNHPLYPHGDPRTVMLIELARQAGSEREVTRTLLDAVKHIEAKFQATPGLELGLVALAGACGLPSQAAGGLFALARTAGWVAHAIEQGFDEFMIRPRAKFEPNCHMP
jgi:citrate synthase